MRSLSRTAASPRAVPLAGALAIASTAAQLDPTCAPFARPLRLLTVKVLQRPIEFAQYVAVRYTERLAEAGVAPSVGSRGDSYDNALAESFNGLYKTELIHRRSWTGLNDVEYETLAYVDWFNRRRLHGEIGMVPPAEFELRQQPIAVA